MRHSKFSRGRNDGYSNAFVASQQSQHKAQHQNATQSNSSHRNQILSSSFLLVSNPTLCASALHSNFSAHQRQKKVPTSTKLKNRLKRTKKSQKPFRHPYQNLAPDIMHSIFQHLIVTVTKRCVRKLERDPQKMDIVREYATSFEFESQCNNKIKSFFRMINGKHVRKRNKPSSRGRSAPSPVPPVSTRITSSFSNTPGNKILHYVKIHKNNGRIGHKLFTFFRGIHSLDLTGLVDSSVTDRDFESLAGIQCLYISNTVFSISERAFSSLIGIHTLHARNCPQLNDEACKYLKGITELDCSMCLNVGDAGLQYIVGVRVLRMSGLRNITTKAFSNLESVRELDMSHLREEILTEEAFKSLTNVEILDCRQKNFSFFVREQVKMLNAKVVRI
mmetsp:Transcript_6082/g.23030  ORF Transcript_6082/g.23030 Transcript_6082/m.23030 type:complete len:391 (-) Transcript_6082:2348-3520(-)